MNDIRIDGTKEMQVTFEEQSKTSAINKYVNNFYKTMNEGNIADTAEGSVFIELGFTAITNKITEYIAIKTTGTRRRDLNLMLQLCDDPKVLTYVCLGVLLPLVIKKANKPTVTEIAKKIIQTLYTEYDIKELKEDNPKLFKYMDSAFKRASRKRKLKLITTHIRKLKSDISDTKDFIPRTTKAQDIRIGTALIDCVLKSGADLFQRTKIYAKGQSKGFTYCISMTASGQDVLKVAHASVISRLSFSIPPMVVIPKQWTTNYDGGLYTKRTAIMKMKTPAGFTILKTTPLPKIYPVLNKLQSVGWRINTFVLDVLSTIFSRNMIDPRSPKKVHRLYGGLPTSEIVYAEDTIRKSDYGACIDDRFINIKDFIRWRRDIEDVTIFLDGEIGRRLQLISAIGEAETYKKFASLYFGYTLDSRSRVYTLQSVLTPQGSAEVKALLEFANGELLTDVGIYWFKIHTANVAGEDKEDFPDRLIWFDTNIQDILSIGERPIECLDLWAYADSPFEYLAACNAWYRHTKGEKVYVPIGLDATCSGLQIYSGLLGDLEGAKTVNVVNTGKREDVYQVVADNVNDSLIAKKYPKFFEVNLSDGTTKKQSTIVEAMGITPKWVTVDVDDDYKLKEGEKWV